MEKKRCKCQSFECEDDAEYYIVWTDPMKVCEVHAAEMIGFGNVMGFMTPLNTVRPLELNELFEEAE